MTVAVRKKVNIFDHRDCQRHLETMKNGIYFSLEIFFENKPPVEQKP